MFGFMFTIGVFFASMFVSVFARLGRGGHDIITLGRRYWLVIDIIVGIRQWGVIIARRLRSRVVKYVRQAWTRHGDSSHQPAERGQKNEYSPGSVHDFSLFGVIIVRLLAKVDPGNQSASGIWSCYGLPLIHPEGPNRAGAGRCPAASVGNNPLLRRCPLPWLRRSGRAIRRQPYPPGLD
jgi:hypothetical protein